MLRCVVLSLCAGTAFRIVRNPCLCSPLGIGAGPILIAGCGGKFSASFSKKTCRSAYNIVIFFLNQFLLRKDLRGKFQLPRLRNIAQLLRLLVRLQQWAFSSLNHKQ
jgi:hypothetical protein